MSIPGKREFVAWDHAEELALARGRTGYSMAEVGALTGLSEYTIRDAESARHSRVMRTTRDALIEFIADHPATYGASLGDRPVTRGDCVDGPRPCPWISCRHHLYGDVSDKSGKVFSRHGDVSNMAETCSLDVAARGPHTLIEVGQLMGGYEREWIRQIEELALKKMRQRINADPKLRASLTPGQVI